MHYFGKFLKISPSIAIFPFGFRHSESLPFLPTRLLEIIIIFFFFFSAISRFLPLSVDLQVPASIQCKSNCVSEAHHKWKQAIWLTTELERIWYATGKFLVKGKEDVTDSTKFFLLAICLHNMHKLKTAGTDYNDTVL